MGLGWLGLGLRSARLQQVIDGAGTAPSPQRRAPDHGVHERGGGADQAGWRPERGADAVRPAVGDQVLAVGHRRAARPVGSSEE